MSEARLLWLENQRGNLIIKMRGQQWAMRRAQHDLDLAKRLAGQYADELKVLDEKIAALQKGEHG